MTGWKEKIQDLINQEHLSLNEMKAQLKELVEQDKQAPALQAKTFFDVQDSLKRFKSERNNNAISIGFADLEMLANGFSKGELTVIAGRPGMGSTRLMQHFLLNSAKQHTCLFVNLESDASKAWYDLLAYLKEIENRQSDEEPIANNDGIMTDDFYKRYENQLSKIKISHRLTADVEVLETQLREMITADKIEILYLDRIQLWGHKKEFKQRNFELAQFMQMLKRLAEELNIAIFAISNVSRSLERRSVKRPMLSDLSDCNAIEEFADKVLLIYRPEYYSIIDEFDSREENIMEIHIAKNKFGSYGAVALMDFDPVIKEHIIDLSKNHFEFKEKRLEEIFQDIQKLKRNNQPEDDGLF